MSSESTEEYNGPMFGGHDIMYLKVAAGLAVLTAIEVVMSYTSLKGGALGLPLMAMALIKFVIVAGFFMHLKFDTPVLRRLFVAGGILASFCYIGVLAAFGRLTGYIHWVLLIIFTIVSVAVFMLRDFSNGGHSDGGHSDGGNTDGHADHGHADTTHVAH